ncbi:hypothetical protein KHA80_16540 [Anaerobacillus sp. HL2]|nr:hypothetical protein KHA80_16540 [Anaerobacillus sp. HL2]
MFDIFSGKQLARLQSQLRQRFQEKSKCEVYFNKKHLFLTLSPIYRNGLIEEIVGTVSDITDLKNSRSGYCLYLAYHDSLTDLPDRRMLDNDSMQSILIAKEADKNVVFYLLI